MVIKPEINSRTLFCYFQSYSQFISLPPLLSPVKRLLSFLPMTVPHSAYAIKFTGLPNGLHEFRFEIDGKFFSHREESIIQNADIEVVAILNKATTMQLTIAMKGSVEVDCVRCLEPVTISLEVEKTLLVRQVEKPNPEDDDDDSIQIAANAHEIDLEKVFYDYLTLQVPYSPVHAEKENGEIGCNPEILKYLQRENEKKEESGNEGTWDALKNIKLN
jgi:uncharacterized metal-binding protein YceD (DUF177 family)